MGGKKWKAMNSFGNAQRKANPRKAKGKDTRLGFIVTAGILVLILALAWFGAARAYGYTDPANCTGATLNDVRVNPSQSLIWTPGPFLNSTGDPVGGGNSSLSFDGVDDYVNIPYAASLDNFGSISIEFWFYPTSLADGTLRNVINKNWGNNGSFLIYTNSVNNRIYFGVAPTWATQQSTYYTLPSANQWYHIICTWASGGAPQIYVNTAIGSTSTATTGNLVNANAVRIGDSSNDLKGRADEVRIYKNRTLTPTEITQRYQGIYLDETGLVLYLDLDGQAQDQSGTGNHGTLNGGPTYTDGWASVPVSTYFNGTISINSRRILIDSTTGAPWGTIPDTAPVGVGVYTAELAPDNSIGNGTINGFIADHYLLDMGTMFTETEAGFRALITCTGESAVDGHPVSVNDTATVEGCSLTGNTYTGNLEGTDTRNTPATVTYDTVNSFLENTYGITSAEVRTSVTVTWTTGTLDRLQTRFTVGDWIGAVFDEEAYLVGGLTLYTFIMLLFSMGIYNYSGVYATFLFWLLGWGVFAGLVHGPAQAIALLLFTLGLGITVAKLYLDRRTT